MRALGGALGDELAAWLAPRGWTGPVTRMYRRADDLEIWTFLFGWPPGYGPSGACSIDVGVLPPLPTRSRHATARRVCNGWSDSLVYHVPACWHRRFPATPIAYRGKTARQLAPVFRAAFQAIERWAATCELAQLAPLAEEMTRSELAFTRKRGRDWQALLAGTRPRPAARRARR